MNFRPYTFHRRWIGLLSVAALLLQVLLPSIAMAYSQGDAFALGEICRSAGQSAGKSDLPVTMSHDCQSCCFSDHLALPTALIPTPAPVLTVALAERILPASYSPSLSHLVAAPRGPPSFLNF